MRKVLVARIFVRRDGSTSWETTSPSGKVLSGGGTRRGKYAPKNAIGMTCKSVEEALKNGGLPKAWIGPRI